jgi:hypothetical protein
MVSPYLFAWILHFNKVKTRANPLFNRLWGACEMDRVDKINPARRNLPLSPKLLRGDSSQVPRSHSSHSTCFRRPSPFSRFAHYSGTEEKPKAGVWWRELKWWNSFSAHTEIIGTAIILESWIKWINCDVGKTERDNSFLLTRDHYLGEAFFLKTNW